MNYTEAYASWILKHKIKTLLMVFLVFAVCAAGLVKTHFSNDYRVYFEKNDPNLVAFDYIQNTFTNSNNVLLVVTPQDKTIFSKETLTALADITARAWKIPYSVRVDSLTNFQHSYADGDQLNVENLVSDPEHLTASAIARIKDIATSEPALVNRLIGPKADVAGVNVNIELPPGVVEKEVVEYVRTMVEEIHAQYPSIHVDLTGMVVMGNVFPEESEKDIKTLVPLMFAMVFISLRMFLGMTWPTLVTALVLGLSNLIAIGISSALGIVLSPVAVSAPTIIMTVAIADCVHLIMSWRYYLGTGSTPERAMIESLTINMKPVFITSFTTAIGFLSMNTSDSPPFRDLGNIVAAGVTAAFFLAIIVLPILVAWVPVKKLKFNSTSDATMEKIGELIIRKPKTVVVVGTIFSLIFFAFIAKNEVNDNFVEYFDKTVDFRKATDYAMEHLTGVNVIEYALDSGAKNGATDISYLGKTEAFANWYRQQPEVLHVLSFTDVIKRLNQNLHNNERDFYALPESNELASQYLLLYELSLPFGLDLNNQINSNKSATRMTVLLKSVTTNEVLALEERAQAWLSEHASDIKTPGASLTVMFAHIGKNNIKSMFSGTFLALFFIMAVLFVMMRSMKLTVISFLVNVSPVAIAFGIWGIFVGQIGVAASVVMSMTLGIVVDDTIHFITKYLHGRKDLGKNAEEAVRYAFSSVGTALWVTTAALMVGFGILSFSSFTANGDMGMLTAVTIGIALLMDLFLLPALILLFDTAPYADAKVIEETEPSGTTLVQS